MVAESMKGRMSMGSGAARSVNHSIPSVAMEGSAVMIWETVPGGTMVPDKLSMASVMASGALIGVESELRSMRQKP